GRGIARHHDNHRNEREQQREHRCADGYQRKSARLRHPWRMRRFCGESTGMSVAQLLAMDKQRQQEGPGLPGPDYFSVVIEWEKEPELSAVPDEDLEDQITDRQIRHWDV